MMKVKSIKIRVLQILTAAALCSAASVVGFAREAQAQEILLTGPLAGAPAVRKQRLYRKSRVELAPQVSFTLLDEYQRLIMVGARLNYNITDWLAIGAWGTFSPPALKFDAALTEEIQKTNELRQQQAGDLPFSQISQNHKLTNTNMGKNFSKQLGTIDWAVAPQVTLIPFRGKIGLFQSIYIDTDFYLFGGPAFVSVTERAACARGQGQGCLSSLSTLPTATGQGPGSIDFLMKSRTTIAPTFGIGFQFYINRFLALGTEWRALPFDRNLGGFDNHGGGPNDEFPDLQVNDKDREFKLNQMISISLGLSIPFQYQVSE